jgi:hypothetical protein
MSCEPPIVRPVHRVGLGRSVLSARVFEFVSPLPRAGLSTTAYVQSMQHYYLLSLGFLLTRIIGDFLMARWLHKGGPAIEELFLPSVRGNATDQG